MELKIDLANREEVAAAVPLLQLILEGVPKACDGVGKCHNNVNVSTLSVTLDPTEAQAAVAKVLRQAADEMAPTPPLPQAAPIAPSIAGAAALPIAPVVLPDTLPVSASVPLPPAPSPAAVVPAPPVSVAPSTPAVSVELDAAGLPWDERIHSSTKSKIANGEWKVKRGVSPATITRVEAELRALMAAAPAVSAGDFTPEQVDAAAVFGGVHAASAIPSHEAVAVNQFTPAQQAQANMMTEANIAAVFGGVVEPQTFEELMPRIAKAVQMNIMPPTAISSACAIYGLTSVVGLQANPGLVPSVWATLQQQFPELK